jgi:hypothetical protein
MPFVGPTITESGFFHLLDRIQAGDFHGLCVTGGGREENRLVVVVDSQRT